MKGRVIGVCILVCLFFPGICYAKEQGTENGLPENWRDSISLEEVESVFEHLQGGESGFSPGQYVKEVMEGKTEFSVHNLWQLLMKQVTEQFAGQKKEIFRILALGLIAGIFMNFAGTVGDKDLGETGFFITFLLLFATISTGFYATYEVAAEALENLLTFMRALIPSFSLTLCFTGGTVTSAAYYETMLIILSLIEMLMTHVFLPGVQVYFLVSMINQLSNNRFSKMAELIRSFLRFSLKVLFGVLIGYQGIQGMLIPVMDKVKNNSVLQAAKGLPGVGNTMGSLADTLFGSGMLIKSAVGVGGLICIIILCLLPFVKIFVFTALYCIGSALLQPVSEKRVVSAIYAAAESGKLLMGYLLAGALMFLISIIIILVCTNLV
ncbi:MAG: stage III sporulation protein AE [Lachnospiraceae bacterium]|nr:stage III sporulation protein AE [Lachnospiraceae bacterium]